MKLEERIAVRVRTWCAVELRKRAEAEGRSTASMARRILEAALMPGTDLPNEAGPGFEVPRRKRGGARTGTAPRKSRG